MINDGDVYRCASCEAPLEIGDGVATEVSIEDGDDGPNMRVLSIDGIEIHRCPLIGPSS